MNNGRRVNDYSAETLNVMNQCSFVKVIVITF